MIQFLNLSGIVNCVTKSVDHLITLFVFVFVFVFAFVFSLSERSHLSTTALQCSEDAEIKSQLSDSLTQ